MPSPFAIGGKLGIDLSRIDDVPAFKVGTKTSSDDGHDYIYVKASAAIPASTAIVVTDVTFAAAAGAGAFTTRAGQAPAINQYFWAQRPSL